MVFLAHPIRALSKGQDYGGLEALTEREVSPVGHRLRFGTGSDAPTSVVGVYGVTTSVGAWM